MIVSLASSDLLSVTYDKGIHAEALKQDLDENEPTALDENCEELYDHSLATTPSHTVL